MVNDDPRDIVSASLDEIVAFLGQGVKETEVLDYKRDLGTDVSETIAAMANGDGGTIIVGVEEDKATKTPKAWTGFTTRDPLGTLGNYISAYLDPAVSPRTNVLTLPDGNVILVIGVGPSTHRVVLHRERGLRVRTLDQSVAPNRSAFERLLVRESTATAEADARVTSTEGRASRWTGPGAPSTRLTVVVASSPIRTVRVSPTEAIDDALAQIGRLLFGGGWHDRQVEEASRAERPYGGPEVPSDFINLSRDGDLDVRYCVQPPGWPGFHGKEWAIDSDQLAIDLIRAFLVPLVLDRSTEVKVMPVAAAIAFSGYEGKYLAFTNEPRTLIGEPFRSQDRRAPITSATLSEGRDAVTFATSAVRALARFMGRRGADVWASTIVDRLRGREELKPWREALGL